MKHRTKKRLLTAVFRIAAALVACRVIGARLWMLSRPVDVVSVSYDEYFGREDSYVTVVEPTTENTFVLTVDSERLLRFELRNHWLKFTKRMGFVPTGLDEMRTNKRLRGFKHFQASVALGYAAVFAAHVMLLQHLREHMPVSGHYFIFEDDARLTWRGALAVRSDADITILTAQVTQSIHHQDDIGIGRSIGGYGTVGYVVAARSIQLILRSVSGSVNPIDIAIFDASARLRIDCLLRPVVYVDRTEPSNRRTVNA